MRTGDFQVLLPLMIVALFSIIVMVAAAIRRSHWLAFLLTVTGFALSLVALPFAYGAAPRMVTRLLVLDYFSLFYLGLIFGGNLVAALLSYDYLGKSEGDADEYYILLILAGLGAALLVASAHFVSFFLGLELLSISLYGLISYAKTRKGTVEAAVKYLILSVISNAFLLFGMALVYARLGTMQFSMIASRLDASAPEPFFLAGIGLMLVAFGFKLAVAPFHMWAPDVYQEAPAPVTAFIAAVSKGAVFALLLRLSLSFPLERLGPLSLILTVLAVVSMLAGNLLALFQQNLKRLLAYSSISHFGYLLVALLASGSLRTTTVSFYLAAYFVAILGIFGIIALYSNMDGEADLLSDYRGLFSRDPFIAVVLTVMLFSLAGIPLTAGFIGKFYIILSGVGSSLWFLVVALIVTSAMGLFYYLRVIITLYARVDNKKYGSKLPLMTRIVVACLFVFLLAWGVYPGSLIKVIDSMDPGSVLTADEGKKQAKQ